METLMKQTNNELRNIARAEGLPYSKLNKATLVKSIFDDRVGGLYREKRRLINSTVKNEKLRGYTNLKNNNLNELRNIARAEGVPYSKLNKATLVERIFDYRAMVGSLYHENRQSINEIAKNEKIRGYTKLKKNDLIQSILYHRRVLKPLLRGQKQLIHSYTNAMLREKANKEGLLHVGRTKKQMIENLAMHRINTMHRTITGKYDSLLHLVNWDKYKDHVTPVPYQHAVNEVYRSFRLNGVNKMDVDNYLKLLESHLVKLARDQVTAMGSIKIQLVLTVEFIHRSDDDIIEKFAKSNPITVLHGSNIRDIINEAYNTLKQSFEKISNTLNDSDYLFHGIVSLIVDIHEVELIRGGSYIKLPEWIENKHAVLNPKNDDDECFKWAVIQALHHEEIGKDPQRINKLKPFVSRYNWNGIKFPATTNQISKFEKQNPDIAVNVLFLHLGKEVRQYYISEYNGERNKIVDLLLIEEWGKKHYCAIKNRSKLLSKLNSNHNGKEHFCIYCLHSFYSEEACFKHMEYCQDHDFCHVKMPKEEKKWLIYQDGSKELRLPFTMYADIECILVPFQGCARDPNLAESYTDIVCLHVPSGFTLYIKFFNGDIRPLLSYRGEDCMEVLVKALKREGKRILNMPEKDMLPLTHGEQEAHKNSRICHICKNQFERNPEKRGEWKVKDHCHYTGQYRGAAHSKCNLAYKLPKYIPVIFHNLSGYDAHLIICELGKQFSTEDIGVIAENKEKYITFNVPIEVPIRDKNGVIITIKTKIKKKDKKTGKDIPIGTEVPKMKRSQLRFIDSCRFMSSSLDDLVSNLVGVNDLKCKICKNPCRMSHINENYIVHAKCQQCYSGGNSTQLDKVALQLKFSNIYKFCGNDECFRLMLRKGVYPYEYMTSWDNFKETQLPSKDEFYSNLYMEGITDNDYKHAQNVWKTFNIADMGMYHDLYMNSDVLLLADVFENFRDSCLDIYKLDPTHFVTAPGLAWYAALKYTKVRLELLTDIDMLLMFEKGIRGGITQAIHRYAAANNKYMGDRYNPTKSDSYLMYLDANNLYGGAMSELLPTHDFRWCEDEFTEETVKKYNIKSSTGYVLEVDLEYPAELHASHNEFPFCPEKMKLDMIEKLVCNLNNKDKYVIHINVLQQALNHGLKLTKVHRVIEFEQSAWLKPYIDLNTGYRTKAKNDFEKDFFKLMNNSVFGKTMENVRLHREMKLVTDEKRCKKFTSKPNYDSTTAFSEHLIGIEMRKVEITMNKPIYLGQAILDLSKITMYEFHYDYMLPKYGKNVQLCYQDTDSLVYHIKTEDFYRDIACDVKARFDTSNYPENIDRPLEKGVNKKVINLMKDELNGEIMTEFVALRPKLYAYKNKEKVGKRAKGTKKCVVKKTITFEDYVQCLDNGKDLYRTQLLFRSVLHHVYTQRIHKVALSSKDNKRIILVPDGIRTLALGMNEDVKNELLEMYNK